ncbi:MAG: polymerase sigma factor SigW [Verrucomicrobiota bacterium]
MPGRGDYSCESAKSRMSLPNQQMHPQPAAVPVADEGRVLGAGQRAELRALVARQLSGEGEEAIEDVLQEVALAFHTADAIEADAGKQDAWLRQVAAHKVQDYWRRVERRRKLRARLAELSDAATPLEPSPYEWVISLESTRDLRAALDRLSEEDRALLEDKYLRDHSYEQLAAGRKISVKTIEYRLLRARQAIRQLLENRTP